LRRRQRRTTQRKWSQKTKPRAKKRRMISRRNQQPKITQRKWQQRTMPKAKKRRT